MYSTKFFPNGATCERCGHINSICTCNETKVELGVPWYLDQTIKTIPCMPDKNGEFVPMKDSKKQC